MNNCTILSFLWFVFDALCYVTCDSKIATLRGVLDEEKHDFVAEMRIKATRTMSAARVLT